MQQTDTELIQGVLTGDDDAFSYKIRRIKWKIIRNGIYRKRQKHV